MFIFYVWMPKYVNKACSLVSKNEFRILKLCSYINQVSMGSMTVQCIIIIIITSSNDIQPSTVVLD